MSWSNRCLTGFFGGLIIDMRVGGAGMNPLRPLHHDAPSGAGTALRRDRGRGFRSRRIGMGRDIGGSPTAMIRPLVVRSIPTVWVLFAFALLGSHLLVHTPGLVRAEAPETHPGQFFPISEPITNR
jgi:hypothetical protein